MILCRFGNCPQEAVFICDHETMGMIMACRECVERYQQTGLFTLTIRRLRNKFMSRNRYRTVPR